MARSDRPGSAGESPPPAEAGSAKGGSATTVTSSGHHPRIGQPHDDAKEGPIAAAELAAARISTPAQPLGPPGKPFDWRSPFFIGMAATGGVAVTVGAILLLGVAAQALLLVALGLFLAVGLEPAVSWFVARGFRRWAAVTSVILILLALLAGFLAVAIPPLVDQGTHLVDTVPQYVKQINDSSSFLGQLNERFQVQQNLEQFLKGSSSGVVSGVLSVGGAVVGTLADVLIVVVLTGYFLGDLPRIRAAIYWLVPYERRPRAILLGDEIMAKVGGYVLGNVVISVVIATATFIWLVAFGVPYPLLLAIVVGLFDLIPVIGSAVAGVLVALAALTVSLPVCLATVGFFVAYKFFEDYLLSPKVFGKVLKLPALVTIVALLIGGALLGIVGALVALPIAAALLLLTQQLLLPRLDRHQASPPGNA